MKFYNLSPKWECLESVPFYFWKKLDLVSYLTKYAANLNSIDVIVEIKEGKPENKDSDLSCDDDDDMHMWEKPSKNILVPNPIAKSKL